MPTPRRGLGCGRHWQPIELFPPHNVYIPLTMIFTSIHISYICLAMQQYALLHDLRFYSSRTVGQITYKSNYGLDWDSSTVWYCIMGKWAWFDVVACWSSFPTMPTLVLILKQISKTAAILINESWNGGSFQCTPLSPTDSIQLRSRWFLPVNIIDSEEAELKVYRYRRAGKMHYSILLNSTEWCCDLIGQDRKENRLRLLSS